MEALVLHTAYFPPIAYVAAMLAFPKIEIEAHENYTKQTYRNRCLITTANGILPLVVPVKKTASGKSSIKDITIDYSDNWQKIQLKALESAYRSSPFFEFYIDEFVPVFKQRFHSLLDLNGFILEKVVEALDWTVELSFTKNYVDSYTDHIDLRDSFHPKREIRRLADLFYFEEYYQVFAGKMGFKPNMSILDLLFHLGPESETYLLHCFQHRNLDKL